MPIILLSRYYLSFRSHVILGQRRTAFHSNTFGGIINAPGRFSNPLDLFEKLQPNERQIIRHTRRRCHPLISTLLAVCCCCRLLLIAFLATDRREFYKTADDREGMSMTVEFPVFWNG